MCWLWFWLSILSMRVDLSPSGQNFISNLILNCFRISKYWHWPGWVWKLCFYSNTCGWYSICAPHANSYHCFENSCYAPINSSWGYNNWTVSLRIPANNCPDMLIEHRLAGVDANPYLLVAALLAGINHGLSVIKEPPPPVEGNAYLFSETELPRT